MWFLGLKSKFLISQYFSISTLPLSSLATGVSGDGTVGIFTINSMNLSSTKLNSHSRKAICSFRFFPASIASRDGFVFLEL